MPFFSPLHRQQIVNAFWSGVQSHCPHDGGRLETHFHPHVAGYLLVMACHCCGTKTQVTRFSDPQRHLFRPWTVAEISALGDCQASGGEMRCPVCDTGLHSYQTNMGEGLECARCGNSSRVSLPVTLAGKVTGAGLQQSVA